MAVPGILLKHCVNVRPQLYRKSKLAAETELSTGNLCSGASAYMNYEKEYYGGFDNFCALLSEVGLCAFFKVVT